MIRRFFNRILRKDKTETGTVDEFIFIYSKHKGKSQTLNVHDSWVEESYINYNDDDLFKKGKNFLGLGLNNAQFFAFLVVIVFGLTILLGRAIYLQIFRGDYYLSIAEQNRLRTTFINSPRGIIYDRHGIPLVKNIPSFAVYLIKNEFDNNSDDIKKQIENWLNEKFGQNDDYQKNWQQLQSINPQKKEYFEPVMLIDKVPYEKALELKIDSAKFPEVIVDVRPLREYLITDQVGRVMESYAHLLGYQGKINQAEYEKLSEKGYLLNDYIGKMGLEYKYEELLRGQYGKEKVEVDAFGRAVKIVEKDEVIKGNNLYLSLDVEMQNKLEFIIKDHLSRLDFRKKASAIVMNPNNGQILAMVSLPGYDNNLFSQGIKGEDYDKLINDEDRPLFNRVVSGEYPSGSSIKPMMAASALEEGVITENTTFSSVGGIRISEWFFPDWLGGGHGLTDVKKAIAQSVNTFFYIIGGGYGEHEGLGVRRIKENLEKFGFNQFTNIDLGNEKNGFLPTPEWKEEVKGERWYVGDTYHLAIGQGDILVTPLQIANATAVFANQGTLYQPRLLQSYYDQTKNEMVKLAPEILNQDFLQDSTVRIIRQGMRQAVTSGSARRLNLLPVASAGKTGTAQWAQEKTPHAWFTGFAPYENPELVITVLLEETGGGDKYAVPVAYDFLKWYFSRVRSEE